MSPEVHRQLSGAPSTTCLAPQHQQKQLSQI